MADAPAEEPVESRSRYADAGSDSSIGRALLVRALAFVVGCFVAAFLVTVLFNDDGMSGVVVGMLLSLSALGFVGTLLAVALGAVRRLRRG